MVKESCSAFLGLLATCFLVAVAPAQDVEQLEQRAALAKGRARLELLIELLDAARTKSVPEVSAKSAEVQRLLELHPDAGLERDASLHLSWHASRKGDTQAGLDLAERARGLAVDLDEASGVAQADYHRAVAHWYRGEHEEAVAAARQARMAQVTLGDSVGLMSTWTLLGAVHRSHANFDEALAAHLEALELARQCEDEALIARSRNNIALVYWDIDENDRAEEYLRQVVPAYRSLGDEVHLASALSNLGLILVENGEAERALPHLEEGLALHDGFDRVRGKVKLLSNLAFAHGELGHADLALDYNLESLALREQLRDYAGMARSLGSVADIHHAAGHYDEAVEAYNRAADSAERSGARDELSAIRLGLADTYEALGDFESAVSALRGHLEIVEDLDRAETARRIAEIEARMELQVQRRQQAAQRAQHGIELERQRLRLSMLAVLSFGFLVGLAALAWSNRTRSRALAKVRQSHDSLERATGRLKESEERYRRVFDDAVVPKLLVDMGDGRIIDANGPAGLLCGLEPAELIGRALTDISPSWLAQVVLSVHESEDCHVEEWRDEEGAVRHAEVWSVPLSLAGRSCTVVTVYDVTERRKVEEDRIRYERLESLGLLAGGIAHDFNNALTSVLGYVSLARMENEDRDLDSLLSEAEDGIDSATRLSSQLVAFAKGGEPQRCTQDVQKLLLNAVHFSLSGSSARVEFDVSPDLWAAELDVGQFNQVVSNLVINADQAMPEAGRLRVCARNIYAERELSAVAGPGPYVRIDFEDNGGGIPHDLQDKVFDPYFTTKDSGTGLGLSTAFAIVSRHEGWMNFESREGEGTVFSLYYPALAALPSSGGLDEGKFVFGRGGSILVMEDDPSIHRVFRAVLAEMGYETEIVEDGEAALDSWFAAKDAGRPFDAVIMDLTVPGGMGGKEAMSILRRRDPEALGIVVSGYSSDPVMADYEQAGFAGALTKPFNVVNLGKLLGRVLHRRIDVPGAKLRGAVDRKASPLEHGRVIRAQPSKE